MFSGFGCSCDFPKLSRHSLNDSNAELYSDISAVDISHPIQDVQALRRRGEADARRILKHLPKTKVPFKLLKLLEIGPGLGHLGKVLQRNFEYYAADLVPFYLVELGLERGKAFLWDVTRGGVQSEFDVIVACDVFEHVLNEGDAFISVNDALKPGGMFYLRVPHKEPLINYSKLLGAPYPYVHLRSYSLKYLREMCSYSGFKVKHVTRLYNHEAVWSRRDFGLEILRRLRSRTNVSQLEQAYSGNLRAFRESQGDLPELGATPKVNLLRRIFTRLPSWLRSAIRKAYDFWGRLTVILFFRPVEIALVLEKPSSVRRNGKKFA